MTTKTMAMPLTVPTVRSLFISSLALAKDSNMISYCYRWVLGLLSSGGGVAHATASPEQPRFVYFRVAVTRSRRFILEVRSAGEKGPASFVSGLRRQRLAVSFLKDRPALRPYDPTNLQTTNHKAVPTYTYG